VFLTGYGILSNIGGTTKLAGLDYYSGFYSGIG